MLERRVAWSVMIVATLTMTVSYVDRQAFAVLGPSVSEALEIDNTAFGWLITAFSIAYLVATPLAGWWIDRVGARRGLVGSVLVWSAVAALHAIVPGFAVLFALRIALGLAEGPGFPGAAQTVQRVLPPAERARGFGVLFTGSSIGGMLVPKLASWLYDLAGWRVAFLGTAAAGLIWIPLWIVVTSRPDVRAVLDMQTAQAQAQARPPFLDLLRRPATIRALLAVFAAAPIVGFAGGWGAKYLVNAFHTAQKDVGDYLWLPSLVFDAGAILFGDLASRRRRVSGEAPRVLFAIGMVLGAALVVLPAARSEWEAVAIASIAMAGSGAMYTIVTAELLARTPAESVSLAGGTLAGAQSLALIVMNPLVGASVDRTGSYDESAIWIACWVIPGAIAWLLLRPRELSA